MSKPIVALGLSMVCATAAFAQQQRTTATANGSSSSSISKNEKELGIQSGTNLSAQLENALDVKKARVGDRVVLKTTEAIKANGRTVAAKGSRLVGRVTDVQRKASANGGSRIGLVFDQLENGSLVAPISATITSVTQARAATMLDDDGFGGGVSGRSSNSGTASAGGSGGGLLGGVGNTVGGVTNAVGGVANTAGGVVNSTAETAGGVAGGAGRSLGSIQILESTGASTEGGSTLSLSGKDMKLEKGTMFRLRLDQAGQVGSN
jgi:hypothetical protein